MNRMEQPGKAAGTLSERLQGGQESIRQLSQTEENPGKRTLMDNVY